MLHRRQCFKISDHKAVIAYTDATKAAYNNVNTKRIRRQTQDALAFYLSQLSQLQYQSDYSSDTQTDFDHFYIYLQSLLHSFYQEHTITITSREPIYMTPVLKALLRRKNRLMRAGRTDEGSALASRSGPSYSHETVLTCDEPARRTSNTRGKKVHEITGRHNHTSGAPPGVTADLLNQHYASVSTDKSYHASSRATSLQAISDFQVFCVLDRLHHTTTGLDRIPAWFLRLGAPLFSDPLAELFNLSFATAVAPTQSKGASITQFAKSHTLLNSPPTDPSPLLLSCLESWKKS